MKIDLSQFLQTFLLESAENVSAMEADLLELRSSPEDTELLNSIFRSAHSIKGGAGSFGYSNLVHFTHALENLLDRLRNNEMRATPEVIALLLQSVDILRELLEAGSEGNMPAKAVVLEEQLETLMPAAGGNSSEGGETLKTPTEQRETKLFKVEFRPGRELFTSGTNPLILLRNLAAMGTVSCCQIHTDDLPPLAELDPGVCYLSWTMELASLCEESELREVFEFVEHLAEIQIQTLEVAPSSPAASTSSASVPPSPEAAVAEAPTPAKRAAKKASSSGENTSIRVSIDKVDRLIDLVGELVIAHVMTAQMVDEFEPACLPKLRETVEGMQRNTRELHERVMSIRMLPVGSLFQRYARTVFDIAQATGKQIRLETDGEETEIDKSMLEMLGDPLTHLIRNSADHGVEAPEVRERVGKPIEGLIYLKAFHRSGRIVIEISDDGAGIDTERVKQRAMERGLIDPDAQMTEAQLRMLIFEPGFSTREEISDLSGRGVGMDVVKRNVQQLNGTIDVVSELGKGTTVTIELPLTLSILEGLLIRVCDRTLVLPLLSVIETVPLPDDHIVRIAEKGEVVVIRDESIPLLRLSRYLGLSGAGPMNENVNRADESRRLAVIVQAGQRKLGLVVDELLGLQQVVVKSLEQHLHKINGLMGATILGDGCVAPIVDVASISTLDLFSLQPIQPAVFSPAVALSPGTLR